MVKRLPYIHRESLITIYITLLLDDVLLCFLALSLYDIGLFLYTIIHTVGRVQQQQYNIYYRVYYSVQVFT